MKRTKSQQQKQRRMVIDALEKRVLLSATVVSSVPGQTLSLTGVPQTIALGTYFDDSAVAAGDTVVNLQTNLPAPNNSIPLDLTTNATPATVSNFLKYVNSGEYADNVVYRAIAGFIVQDGGYKPDGSAITSLGSIPGESATETQKNVTGTIAMALSTGPNSGSDAWFINVANNSELDNTSDGGPFTTFGKVLYNGLSTVNYFTTLPLENDTGVSAFDAANIGEAASLPVLGGTNGATVSSVPVNDLVTTTPVIVPGGLTYTVVSSNPSVVSTSVTGASLSLTPVTEGSANVTVTATDLGGGTTSSSFTVNVAAAAAPPALAVANASGTFGTDTQISFPITLSSASSTATTLAYTVTPGTAPAGDFSATASTLTIPAGSVSATIPVTLVGDTTGAQETFVLTLSSLSTNATFSNGLTTETATGIINPTAAATPTTTTLTASSSVVALNGPETFTATVAGLGATPVGNVTFNAGGVSIGTAALSNGVATLATDLSVAGNETVTAVYSGDTADMGSTSNALTVNVASLAPVVTKDTVPVSVIGGTAVKGGTVVTLTNNTATTEKGTVTVLLYATTDGVIDSNSVQVGNAKSKVNIAPGKSAKVSVSVKSLPADLSTGVYTLLTQTIDTNLSVSNATTGPTVTIVTPVVTLTPSFTKLVLPTSVVAGSKTKLAALVKITNRGNITSSGTTSISLYASTDGTVAGGMLINTVTKKLAIGAGKAASISVPLSKYPSVVDGSYFIVAAVTDPTGVVTQAPFGSKVTIAAPQIDLADTFVSIPATGTIGKSFVVTLSIVNSGNVAATGTLDTLFEESASSAGTNPITLNTAPAKVNIKPGATLRLKLKAQFPTGFAAGNFFLIADVDPNNLFSDVNLTNNSAISATSINMIG